MEVSRNYQIFYFVFWTFKNVLSGLDI